jgi:MFS family permease
VKWRYQTTVLAIAVLANFTQQGTRLLISPIVPNIIAAFGSSKSAIGLALTGMWAAYALFQYPSGFIGDEFGERRVIAVSLALTGAGSLLLAVAPTFWLFGVFAVLLGAGTGLYFTAASSLLTKLFDNTGQALGFHTAGISLAGLVAPVAAGFIGLRFGWRWAIVLGAVLAFPVTLLILDRVRPLSSDAAVRSLREQMQLRSMAALVLRPGIAFMTVLAAAAVFVNQSFMSIFPTFLIENHRLDPGVASIAFGGIFVLSSVAQPAMGRLSDYLSRKTAIGLSLSLTAIGFWLVLASGSTVSLVVALVVIGLGISWAGVFHAWFMDLLGGADQGRSFGFIRTVYMFLGASGSVVTGSLADSLGWSIAYGVVIALLAGSVLALLARRSFGWLRPVPE